MKQVLAMLSLKNCRYEVQGSRELCARVTVCSSFYCSRSYVLEHWFCGFDSGLFQVCSRTVIYAKNNYYSASPKRAINCIFCQSQQMTVGHLHEIG